MGETKARSDTTDSPVPSVGERRRFQERLAKEWNLNLEALQAFQDHNLQLLQGAIKPAEFGKMIVDMAEGLRRIVPPAPREGPKAYDIFLSYRSLDHDRVGELKAKLERLGYTVYWDREDSTLDRSAVNQGTAERLRERMRRCRSLMFAVSSQSGTSKWMPWELGFFDGRTGRVFVYPLDSGVLEHNTGQQYLDFYPLIDVDNIKDWLEERLPHEEPALPWGEPAGPEMTQDYGDWFGRNWPRIAADPAFAMELWGNLWQAWFRLLAGAKDRSE